MFSEDRGRCNLPPSQPRAQTKQRAADAQERDPVSALQRRMEPWIILPCVRLCAFQRRGNGKRFSVKGRLKAELRPYLVSIKTFCAAEIYLRLQQGA